MSTLPSQQYLQQIYTLLSNATSASSSQIQSQIYSQLSNLQHSNQFYMGLITIASTVTAQPMIRQMALLTLKSALKRNQDTIQFTNEQHQYLRNWVIKGNYQGMEILRNPRRLLVSVLALWGKNIDLQILKYLLACVNEEGQNCTVGLQTLKVVFEDIKFQTQNFNCFETPQFAQFLKTYFQLFSTKITTSGPQITQKLLVCTNLLLKYTTTLPNSNQTLHQYISTYLIPLLSNPNIGPNLIQVAFQGIQQIIQINHSALTPQALQIIINYNISNDKNKRQIQITKKWLNVVLDIVDKFCSDQQKLKPYLKNIVDKTIRYLSFTKEDQANVKMQMQQQNNPYQYQQDQQSQDDLTKNQHRGFLAYTKRKLSVFIFQQLFSWYPQQVWPICQPYLKNLLQSQNFVQRQIGVLLSGIIFSLIEDHLQFLQIAIPVIMSHINQSNLPDILRSTSLWTFSKMAYIITRQQALTKQIMNQLIICAQNSTGQVHDAVYSTLDDFIRNSEDLPANFNDLFLIVVNGIRNCSSKPLNSVLKICATLYEKHADHISQEVTEGMLKQLCAKWAINSQVQSIMSPVLQCLVTISSTKTQVFKKYAFQIFSQAFLILQREHQKNLILRAVDLLSSIVSTNNSQINQVLTQNQQLHSKINSMLMSEQNQIKNFTYGFLGDICKVCSFPKFAEIHCQTIGNSCNIKNLTSCSNSLTCLTDLIIAHPFLGQKYGKNVIQIAVQKLKTNNLQLSYGFNFARIYGRLGNICPVQGSEYIGQVLQFVSVFLKCHEHQKLTNQAFRGILQMISKNPQSATKSFQYFVDSFMTYPSQDKELQNKFLILLKSFKSSLNVSQWNAFLNKPVFLPALAKRIDAISN